MDEKYEENPMTESDSGESTVDKLRNGPVKLRLLDAALWQAFRREGTEMIITKAGRRMFPFVMVTLEGLSPTLLYSVHLSLAPCDNHQYKFCQRRWVSVSDAPPGPSPPTVQSYLHPASPNRGSFWCQEMISFAKLKITNNKHSQGDIILQSMRKYMATVRVREDLGNEEFVFPLPETTFVAVTQYQNESITRMKIAHNPFANGFKYAHVTGTDDINRSLLEPEKDKMQSSKHKRASSSLSSGMKSSTKTARVKATITPQVFPSMALFSHQNQQLASEPSDVCSAVSLEASLPAATFTGDSTALRVMPFTYTATVSPYVFNLHCQEGQEADPPIKNELCSQAEEGDHLSCDDNVGNDVDVTNAASTVENSRVSPSTVDDSHSIQPVVSSHDDRRDGDEAYRNDKDSSKNSFPETLPVDGSTSELHLPEIGNESFREPLARKIAGTKKMPLKRSLIAMKSEVITSGYPGYKNSLPSKDRNADHVTKCDRGVQLKLHDAQQWREFRSQGSVMTVCKEGRPMSPLITFTIRGLDPARLYSVWLNVSPAEDAVSATVQQNVWGSMCSFPRIPPVRPYMHPSSPMRGLAWMKADKVKFDGPLLTLDSTSDNPAALRLTANCKYLTQIVIREEEEVTPGTSGSPGDLLVFTLPETNFVTSDGDVKQPKTHVLESQPDIDRSAKRVRNCLMSCKEDTSGISDDIILPRLKMASLPDTLHWGSTTAHMNKVSDTINRLNPMFCLPGLSMLPPAHVGLSTNRMSPASQLQAMSMMPYPYHPLFHQMRASPHSAFGFPVSPFNPFSLFNYPLGTIHPGTLFTLDEDCKGLDLSVKQKSDTR